MLGFKPGSLIQPLTTRPWNSPQEMWGIRKMHFASSLCGGCIPRIWVWIQENFTGEKQEFTKWKVAEPIFKTKSIWLQSLLSKSFSQLPETAHHLLHHIICRLLFHQPLTWSASFLLSTFTVATLFIWLPTSPWCHFSLLTTSNILQSTWEHVTTVLKHLQWLPFASHNGYQILV